MANWLIGVDTGGTFTDLIAVDQASGALRRAKVPSVPSDPSLAVLDALEKLFAGGSRAGRRTPCSCTARRSRPTRCSKARACAAGLLITHGFRAVYEARGWSQPRGSRPARHVLPEAAAAGAAISDRRGDRAPRLRGPGALPRSTRRRCGRRCASFAQGRRGDRRLLSVLLPQSRRTSGARPRSSREEAPDCRISISIEVLPVIREYPRLSTTVIDAYVGPRIADYLHSLEQRLDARRRRHAAAISDAVERRADAHLDRRAPSQPDAALGAGGRRHRRRRAGTDDAGAAMSSPSTWAARRPTSASSSTAPSSKLSQGQIAGQDIGTPMLQACARWARAAARSPRSARTGC